MFIVKPIALFFVSLIVSSSAHADSALHAADARSQQVQAESSFKAHTVAGIVSLAANRDMQTVDQTLNAADGQTANSSVQVPETQPSFQDLNFTIDDITKNKERKKDLIAIAKTKICAHDAPTVSALIHLMQTFPDAAHDLADEALKHENINSIVKHVINEQASGFAPYHAHMHPHKNKKRTARELVEKYVLWPTATRCGFSLLINTSLNIGPLVFNQCAIQDIHHQNDIPAIKARYNEDLEKLNEQLAERKINQQVYEDGEDRLNEAWRKNKKVLNAGRNMVDETTPVDFGSLKRFVITHPGWLVNSALVGYATEKVIEYADQATGESIRLPEYSWKKDNKYQFYAGQLAKFCAVNGLNTAINTYITYPLLSRVIPL